MCVRMAEQEDFVSSLRGLTAAQLMDKKEAIEKETNEFSDILQTQKGVGMDGALLDSEGFPRSDIDVYAVRTARHKILCLQNDHKAVMSEIEKALHKLHAAAREDQGGVAKDTSAGAQQQAREQSARGFARVSSVAEGSPAALAGLLVGDLLTEFGSVTCGTFKTLQDIGTVVQHSQGSRVRVVVNREQKQVVLSLTPQQWSGRGLLGCNIVPV